MKKLFQSAMFAISTALVLTVSACNTTQVRTSELPQTVESQDVQAIVSKVEPYLEFDTQGLLKVSDLGLRELSTKELSFAQNSIAETNKIVSSGEWKYGKNTLDKLTSAKVVTQGYMSIYVSGCGWGDQRDNWYWWGIEFVTDNCGAVRLARIIGFGSSRLGLFPPAWFSAWMYNAMLNDFASKSRGNGVVLKVGPGWYWVSSR